MKSASLGLSVAAVLFLAGMPAIGKAGTGSIAPGVFWLVFQNQTKANLWVTGGGQGNQRNASPVPAYSQHLLKHTNSLTGQMGWSAADGLANFAWATTNSKGAGSAIASATVYNIKIGGTKKCPPGSARFYKFSSKYMTCAVVYDKHKTDGFMPLVCAQNDYKGWQGGIIIAIVREKDGKPQGTCPNNPLLIRPFGDSITYGWGYITPSGNCQVGAWGPRWAPNCPLPTSATAGFYGGYRGWMTVFAFSPLNVQGTLTFTTEGYQIGGSSAWQWTSNSQLHDGYPGWRTDQLLPIAWLPSAARYTLVHAGTNDIIQNFGSKPRPITPQKVAGQLKSVVDAILAKNQYTHVYLAQIIPFVASIKPAKPIKPAKLKQMNTFVQQYNALIPGVAKGALDPSRVTVVDMSQVLVPNKGYYWIGGVHPNCEGYRRMACTWIKALRTYPAPSVFTPDSNPCAGMPVVACPKP